MLIRCLCVFAILLVLVPFQASGKEVAFSTQKGERISSVLPDSWRALRETELRKYLEGRVPPATGTPLAGYVEPGAAGNTAILFVFHALPDTPVAKEQRQKMFSWFKKNRDLLKNMLPAPVSGMTMENLEYIQDRQTILFATKVTMPERELHGVSGIVFMRRGYLNIIGYETDGGEQELPVLTAFIKNISLPPTLEDRHSLNGPSLAWLRDSWQQIIGAGLILGVYAYAFLMRGRRS